MVVIMEMQIDTNVIKRKMDLRVEKIEMVSRNKKIPILAAAMWVDQNAPITTNRIMLAEAGVIVDTVTEDNYIFVIESLNALNIKVSYPDPYPVNRIVEQLNDIIDEEINECWGGPDMQEFIHLNPENI